MQWHVHDAVGTQCQQRVDIVGRLDAELSTELYEVTHVLPDLLLAEGIKADQLELWSIQNRLHGLGGNFTRGPLHDSKGTMMAHLSLPMFDPSAINARLIMRSPQGLLEARA